MHIPMRIDRARLSRAAFSYSSQIETRFSDLDILGHVNNVAASALLQEGRNRFHHHCGLLRIEDKQVVVASTLIEYAGDLFHPDPVEVCTGVIEIGRSSMRLGQIGLQNGSIGIYAEVVLVARDASGPTPLPQVWRDRLEAMRLLTTG